MILAYLSAVRRHRAQCALNLRIMLEYACVALFALGEPDEAKVIGSEPDGSPLMQDRTKERAYKWLDKHHVEVSARFKKAKVGISKFEAHGGVIGTGAVFDWDRLGGDEFYASFFDEGGIEMVHVSLWQIGNFSMGVMSALVIVNRTYGEPLTFNTGIHQKISDYEIFDRNITAELVAAGTWPDVRQIDEVGPHLLRGDKRTFNS